MADVVSPKKRSKMMSGIRSKNTKPEILIRKAVHKEGFRFRLHLAELPGKPDLVLSKYRAVIFTHGCFWHGHDCSLFKWPSSRQDFWKNKINRNKEKDEESLEKLMEEGWRVMIIWECALKGKQSLKFVKIIKQVSKWLMSKSKHREIRGTNL